MREEQALDDTPQGPKGRSVLEHIAHERAAAACLKVVVMVEVGEGAAHHAVPEMVGTIVDRNATREVLPDAQMPSTPRDLVPRTEETRGLAGDGPFACWRR